ncbi:SDR family NAD(P)-dependent oxidoreductase [Amycolatopsis rubida]|uniref:SDR family NAD(P)-dependent oxidoreductase n=1 Tax=Amycolatopsis rubida TaxID=112413 RepID=A0ABX0BUZ6_9PSEU|nr:MULTISPECIES: SDR family NAD(P)-dependent oxidoreductase [Amycolatopsis]MYW94202.1 SDR family NAD(P)-dependent oxidoreductase [Amycolatopsis rubida]NEC59191.1 SDR family NAD(P)-dependent oxidoreductase [Amycolatopsis rubida]OAP20866.1 Rhamnolipids biosynthesis 3-oxoacyl-[acyl-carrier-protein] reductase [Amycolatopsis sp. M39]
MTLADIIDTALDRTVLLGYGNVGLRIRRQLPGWPADPPPMPGKVVLVTGAGSGIGQAAAVGFARLGASVRVLGRTDERAGEAADGVRARVPDADVRAVTCDLSSVAEIRAFLDRFTAAEERLDMLVNNAGVMPDNREHSTDGVELTFATHVLAPWLLVDGLAPLLGRTAPSRVINVTSGGQYDQKIPGDDLGSEHISYGPKKIYARTKREQLVLTEQWAVRLADQHIHVHAMHPGWADTQGVRGWMPVFRKLTRPIIRDAEEGADTVVWLGASPEAIESTGRLWHDRRARPVTYWLGAGADDGLARARLWDHVSALANASG